MDVGLLCALSKLPARTLIDGDKIFTEFNGALAEQYVLQQLKTLEDMGIAYWISKSGNAEIDFDLENADTTADGYKLHETDLAKEIESMGINPVTFPEAMVRKECKISKIENLTVDESLSLYADITFIYNNYNGSMLINQKTPYEEIAGVRTVMDVDAGEMINVNGMDVLVFEQEKTCTITYRDNLTDYTIYLECDFETAKEFAKTIK